jgi:hypothetical protein
MVNKTLSQYLTSFAQAECGTWLHADVDAKWSLKLSDPMERQEILRVKVYKTCLQRFCRQRRTERNLTGSLQQREHEKKIILHFDDILYLCYAFRIILTINRDFLPKQH